MTPGCFDWPMQYAGDTAEWRELRISEAGAPISLTGATIKMQVMRRRGQTPLIDLTSVANDGIEITDAENGVFRVGGFANPDIEAMCVYDLEITFADGFKRTFLAGVYPIQGQVTT